MLELALMISVSVLAVFAVCFAISKMNADIARIVSELISGLIGIFT